LFLKTIIVSSITLSHIKTEKLQKLELDNLNHVEFNHTLTLTTLFPQSIYL